MKNVQTTLKSRDTYTPPNASQVRCNCDSVLNNVSVAIQDSRHSVSNLKTDFNISEVNQLRKEGQNLRVFVHVLNMRGKPLMPTTPRKARILLKEGKAKVVKRTPFTVQLKYATGETIQPITLGIDAGYKFIGFSAITNKKEVSSGRVELRTNISKKLEEKKKYRRLRRHRNTRYRKSRFNNKRNEKKRYAPSIQNKIDAHICLINKLSNMMPVNNIKIEVSSFDTQKMQNPEISGIEYQQGTLFGYEIREYLLEKYNRTCVYCKKTDVPLEVEHIIPKTKGGSNRVSNLAIACHECNQKKGNLTASDFGHPEVEKQCKETLRASAFMNIIKWQITNQLKEKYKDITVEHTYGYITKHNRIKLGLKKSHINDAFVIAGGTIQKRCREYFAIQTRRNNRQLEIHRKGYARSIRKQRYIIQPNDLLFCKDDNTIRVTTGIHSKGRPTFADRKDISPKKIKLIQYGKGIVFRINKEKKCKKNCNNNPSENNLLEYLL